MLPVVIVVEDLDVQTIVVRGDNDVVSLVPPRVGGILDHLGPRELLPPVDGYDGIRIDDTGKVVGILQPLGTVEGDGHDTDGLVDGGTSQHLGNLDGEDVRRIHHGRKVTVNLLLLISNPNISPPRGLQT